ncbi:MAG TPA: ABC transporter ATP-binding protein [Vineibacter sp.]|nr:ABC transporter ATP-binding protein [Vineibacter sp.]
MTALAIDIREKRYPAVGRAGANLALQALRFEVARGELVCIVGPSGCGKTTLLNIIAGLDHAYSGQVTLPPASDGRPPIGYVFQNARLLPWRTVLENIELALPQGAGHRQRVLDLLAATGLGDVAHVYPERLSVGMGRRVALARAFAIDPQLLLLDEPFVSLDEPTADRLRQLLIEIWQRQPTTVLFVTHDLREAILLADRIILLSPPPARVAASIPIPVPRDARGSDTTVDTVRRQILDEFGESLRAL